MYNTADDCVSISSDAYNVTCGHRQEKMSSRENRRHTSTWEEKEI